jgi:hypothetical protein
LNVVHGENDSNHDGATTMRVTNYSTYNVVIVVTSWFMVERCGEIIKTLHRPGDQQKPQKGHRCSCASA